MSSSTAWACSPNSRNSTERSEAMPMTRSRKAGQKPAVQRPFRERVYEIVRAIPPGRVMTYGGIAECIPPPPGMDWAAYARIRARWAGYALAECPHVQRLLLEREGMSFRESGQIDLERVVWSPDPDWRAARGLL